MEQSRQDAEPALESSMSGLNEQSATKPTECACETVDASKSPPVNETEVCLQHNCGSREAFARQLQLDSANSSDPEQRPTMRPCIPHSDHPSSAECASCWSAASYQAQSQVGHEIADSSLQGASPLGNTSGQLSSVPCGHDYSYRGPSQDRSLHDSPLLVDQDLRLAGAEDDSGANRMAATPPHSSAASTVASTPTHHRSPPSHDNSDIYAYLQARLSDPDRPGTCTPSSSQSSTSRRSTRSHPSTSATTARATLSPSSSRLSSGASTPKRPSRSSTSSRRASTTSKPYKTPIRASNPDSSLLATASDTFPRLVIVQHAVSASAYILVTLLAGLTLLAFVLAGYGLTFVDDARRRMRRVKNRATRTRRKILLEIGRRAKLLSEELAERARKLEDPSVKSRTSDEGTRWTTFSEGRPQEPKNDHASSRTGPVHASSKSVFTHATAIAAQSYRILASQAFVPSFFNTYTAFSRTDGAPGQSNYRQPSSSPSKATFQSTSASSASSETGGPRHKTDYLPPRPPLRSLIPSILLALLLALVAFIKTTQSRRASAGK